MLERSELREPPRRAVAADHLHVGPALTRKSSTVFALSLAVTSTVWPSLVSRRTIGANSSGCGELARSIQIFIGTQRPLASSVAAQRWNSTH